MENKNSGAPAQARSTADKLVKLALLAAISVILALLIHFPILPQLSFLEYDMADVPILIGTFLYGPFWGLLLTLVVSIIQGVTVSASSGIIGIVMHFIATGGFVLVAGLIYRGKRRTLKYAIIALIAGALTMIALMVPLNYFISPLFIQSPEFPYKAAQSTIWSMMWLFVAFNAIKAFGNALITFLLYKAVGRVLKLQFVRPANEPKAE